MFCVYAVLIGARITTSHTGIFRGDSSEHSQVLIGEPRQERSDEFLRGSPLVISGLRGNSAGERTPFEITNTLSSDADKFSFINLNNWLVTPDILLTRALSFLLPLEQAFAANWWASHLLLFLAFPLWIRLMGGRLSASVLTCIGIAFAAPSAWFSYLPLLLTANATAGFACLILSFKKFSIPKVPWIARIFPAIFVFMASKFLFTVAQYPPWGFPILLVVGGITLGWMFENKLVFKRLRLWVFVVTSGVFVTAVNFWANRSIYRAVLSTIYPGQRRATGASGETPFMGGALSWMMQTDYARKSGFTNPEMAYGPTILLVAAAALLVFAWSRKDNTRGVLPSTLGFFFASTVVIWGQSTWPELLTKFNPLILVPGPRASMIVSILALILIGHAVSTFAFQAPWPQFNQKIAAMALVMFLIAAMWSAEDVEWLRLNFFGNVAPWKGFFSLVISSLIVAFFFAIRRRIVTLAMLTALIVMGSIVVNPWTIGLGPLNSSQAVNTVQSLSKQNPSGRWATTGFYLDALMMSSGVPELSGQQYAAPDKATWGRIDPQSNFEEFWNRGQAYINFQLSPGQGFTIWNPSPDVIQIVGDPCDPRFQVLKLEFYVTQDAVKSNCIVNVGTFNWNLIPTYVYQIE